MTPEPGRTPRLLIVVNTDWFFLSHRLALAEGAREAGFDVHVMTPDTGRAGEIRRAGFGHTILPVSRDGLNPAVEALAIARLARLYRALRPDIIHHVTPKPVVYGSLAARALSEVSVVNAVSGLGYVFSSERTSAVVVRPFVRRLYRVALNHPRSLAIFQNPDDLAKFDAEGILPPGREVLIRGSGVDCREFRPSHEPEGRPVVMLPSRMLKDKGVREFVEAARMLRAQALPARFVLVGDPDPGNPSSVSEERLRAWQAEGVVEWWGHRTDMPQVLAAANVVVLPSYREGLPKVLLEAAASGRAIVSTDVPGCREATVDGVNGLRVPVMNAARLAEAIRTLVQDADLRREYGAAGRRLALEEFAVESVVARTLEVYRRLLFGDAPAARSAPAQRAPSGPAQAALPSPD